MMIFSVRKESLQFSQLRGQETDSAVYIQMISWNFTTSWKTRPTFPNRKHQRQQLDTISQKNISLETLFLRAVDCKVFRRVPRRSSSLRSGFQSWKQNSHKFGQVEILFRNNKSESAWEFWRNYCPDFSNYSKRYGKRLHDYVNCGQISDIVNFNFLFDPKFGRC